MGEIARVKGKIVAYATEELDKKKKADYWTKYYDSNNTQKSIWNLHSTVSVDQDEEKEEKEFLEVQAQPQPLTNIVESLEEKREVKPITRKSQEKTIHAKKKTSRCNHKKTASKSQGDKREVKPITRKSQEKTSHAKKKTSPCDHKKTASKSQGDKREVKPITRKSQEK